MLCYLGFLKTKFYTRIFFVNLTLHFYLIFSGDENNRNMCVINTTRNQTNLVSYQRRNQLLIPEFSQNMHVWRYQENSHPENFYPENFYQSSQQYIIGLPSALSGLSSQKLSLKTFLIFFPKKPCSGKVSYIFSKKFLIFWKLKPRKNSLYFRKRNFLIFWERYIQNPRHIQNYNHGHNILRIFDVLPSFPFTISETKPDYW